MTILVFRVAVKVTQHLALQMICGHSFREHVAIVYVYVYVRESFNVIHITVLLDVHLFAGQEGILYLGRYHLTCPVNHQVLLTLALLHHPRPGSSSSR